LPHISEDGVNFIVSTDQSPAIPLETILTAAGIDYKSSEENNYIPISDGNCKKLIDLRNDSKFAQNVSGKLKLQLRDSKEQAR
ncbi:MAG: hypothetical protein KGI29_08295, partial [Pseudomonadota bacterium]|nr:hypothetical protein [Pseudomonadota bacterium]